MRGKQKTISGGKLIDLPLHLILQFTAQAKNKFMSGMCHTARSAVRIALKRKQKRLHPANKSLAAQSFKDTARERHARPFICLQEYNLLPLCICTKKRC